MEVKNLDGLLDLKNTAGNNSSVAIAADVVYIISLLSITLVPALKWRAINACNSNKPNR